MKFVFVINPAAGVAGSEQGLLDALKEHNDLDYEVYYTKSSGDAVQYVDNFCKNNPDKELCFVSAGGDGTLNEVINGMFSHKNACFTCWPCGSGNDYVKYFGGAKKFLNLEKLINGKTMGVDVMHFADRYAVNIINFGFDCKVVRTMEQVKRKPFMKGKNAYTAGIITALVSGRRNNCQVKVDGEELNDTGIYCLCTLANGSYVGGSYKCAPRSVINDGLIEVCYVRPISMLRFVSVINSYKNGTHLDNKDFNDIVIYRQGHVIEVDSPEDMDLCVDGELVVGKHFVIENLHEAIKFLVPAD